MPNETQSVQKEIEVLRKRHEDLNTKKIQAKTSLDHAETQLRDLKEKAKQEYGTDDLDALRKKLEEMKAENERKCKDYKDHLDTLEKKLDEIEKDYKETTEEVT